jgi:hypothetical protein
VKHWAQTMTRREFNEKLEEWYNFGTLFVA